MAEAATDIHLWAAEQVACLQGGELSGLDATRLALTLTEMTDRLRAEARACVRRVASSLLLHEHGPWGARQRRLGEAIAGLNELGAVLTPSLAEALELEWGRLYAAGATQAAEIMRDYGCDPADLPRDAPWTWEEIFASWVPAHYHRN